MSNRQPKFRFKKIRLFLGGLYFSIFVKTYRRNGLILHIPFDLTNYKFRGRFALNRYEMEEARYLGKYLPSNAKVLELGGCLGYVSCMINTLLEDKSQQVTLEANPDLIPWIEKNRKANACHFGIEHSIISLEEENTFYIHKLIVGGSTKRKTPKKTIVKGISIAALKEKYGVDFDTLVMDIEGGELFLFRNFKEPISQFKRIFLEVHPFAGILTQEEAQECEDILSNLGFELLVRDGHFQIWEKNTTAG